MFQEKRAVICDMDGVLYHGNRLLPDVWEFTEWLKANKKQFLFLTNSSERSPHELQQKLDRLGIKAEASHFYTSALATASFLAAVLTLSAKPSSQTPFTMLGFP